MKAQTLIISLLSGLLVLSVVHVHSKATGMASSPRALNKHEKVVVFSFDGFRYDYLDKVSTPNLKELRTNGVSTRYLLPAFTTKTFVNHQSFVTGLYPESHGVVDNTVYDPEYGKDLTGFVEYNDEFWNFDDNVVPIWTLNEWAGDGRISGVQFPGANQHYGANKTLPTHYFSYNGDLSYEDRMDFVISWLTNETHPANLVFMYFEQPDTDGHAYGPDSPEVAVQISRMDNMTKYLIDKLKELEIFDQVNLLFWSDHGMQEVNLGNRINLTEIVNVPADTYDKYGSTPIIQVQPKPGNETTVYEAFKAASLGMNFRVYNRSETPYRWHYQNNRRISDILVVADPGFVFDDYRSWDNSTDYTKKYGVHGYDNDALTMRPFFIAHGPKFKVNYVSAEFDSLDLFPLIANLIGIEPAPSNGSFAKVSGLLMETQTSAASEVRTFGSKTIGYSLFCGLILAKL